MRRWSNEIVVGAGILLAIGIGIYGYVFLREIPVRRHGFTVTAHFNNVTGLHMGDAVTVSGLKVGRIQGMQLQSDHVAVKIWLNGEHPFPHDSRAAIRSIGMIGEKYIDIMPGASVQVLQEGDIIAGVYIGDLADAGGSVTELLDQVNALMAKLSTVLDTALNHEAQKAVSATLINTERLTRKLDGMLDANRRHLENTLTALDSLSSGLNAYWQRRNDSIDTLTQNLSASAAQMPQIIAQIDSALASTRKLLAAVENQQGAVGKALYDDELYRKANQTVEQMQALLNDVKKNPGKYMQAQVGLINF